MKKQFFYSDFKSPTAYILLIVLVAFPIAATLLSHSLVNRNLLILVYVLFGIIILTVLVTGLSKKLITTDEGIIFKSWRTEAKINWEDIKSWGAFSLNRYTLTELDIRTINAPGFGSQVFLFVSVNENHKPGLRDKIDTSYINFPYQLELLNILKERLS